MMINPIIFTRTSIFVTARLLAGPISDQTERWAMDRQQLMPSWVADAISEGFYEGSWVLCLVTDEIGGDLGQPPPTTAPAASAAQRRML
jgi:hypothetical protein